MVVMIAIVEDVVVIIVLGVIVVLGVVVLVRVLVFCVVELIVSRVCGELPSNLFRSSKSWCFACFWRSF